MFQPILIIYTNLILLLFAAHVSCNVDIFGLFTFTRCDVSSLEDCSNALINEQRMSLHNTQNEYSENVRLCFKDVQNDNEILFGLLLPFIDGKKHHQIYCRDNKTMTFNNERFFIFTYMSFELTRIASSLLLPLGTIPLISVTDRVMFPAYYLDHPLAVYSYQSSFGVEMHREGFIKLKNLYNVTAGAIVNLHNKHSIADTKIHAQCTLGGDSAWCLYTNECPGDCYKEVFVNAYDQSAVNSTKTLLVKERLSFVILAGESHVVNRFIDDDSLSGTEFYLPYIVKSKKAFSESLNMTSYIDVNILVNFPGTFAINYMFYYIYDLSGLLLHSEKIWKGILPDADVQTFIKNNLPCTLVKFYSSEYQCGDAFTYKLWSIIPTQVKNLLVSRIVKEKAIIGSMFNYFKLRYYMQQIDYLHLTEQYVFNPTKALKMKPFCHLRKPLCQAGEQLVHSLYNEPNWQRSKGWNCQLCPPYFYKPLPGNNEPCIFCKYPLTTNANRSLCYDPFQLKTIKASDPLMICVLVFSAFVFTFILLTMFIFYVNRQTPMVLSSNRPMTVLQLTMHLVLSTLPIYLYLGKLTLTKCILRQVIIGVAFSITISVNISKTQKIFMIASKTTLMTRSEILLTKASEWLIIGIAILFNMSLHLTTVLYYSFSIQTKYHDKTVTKENYCSNGPMTAYQLLYATFLIVINGIQGMRGRKLPSQFRETTHVIYSFFISFIVIVSTGGIYVSRVYFTDQALIVFVVTIVLNTVHFALLYSYKAYIILFKSDKNTRKTMNQKRISRMQSNFRKSTILTSSTESS